MQLLLFVLRFLTKQITWGMLKKKKKVGTPRVVSGRRRPHASYAPDNSGLKLVQTLRPVPG